MKATLVVVLPVHVDFPLFRYMIKKSHHFFEDVIVVFSNENQIISYKPFILKDLPFIKSTGVFIQKPDWRDSAVNSALALETNADYYIFFEPDFLINHDTFWKKIFEEKRNFIYYNEHGRIHPAFTLVSRDLINKTSKDFSAHPDDKGLDHFGVFFHEIKELDNGIELRDLYLKEKEDFYHMSGTTQNYWCAEHNQPIYKEKEFLQYNYLNMILPHQISEFYNRELAISEKYGYLEGDMLSNFFPKEHDL